MILCFYDPYFKIERRRGPHMWLVCTENDLYRPVIKIKSRSNHCKSRTWLSLPARNIDRVLHCPTFLSIWCNCGVGLASGCLDIRHQYIFRVTRLPDTKGVVHRYWSEREDIDARSADSIAIYKNAKQLFRTRRSHDRSLSTFQRFPPRISWSTISIPWQPGRSSSGWRRPTMLTSLLPRVPRREIRCTRWDIALPFILIRKVSENQHVN